MDVTISNSTTCTYCMGCDNQTIPFPENTWCYMFSNKPEGKCMQHTNYQRPPTINVSGIDDAKRLINSRQV